MADVEAKKLCDDSIECAVGRIQRLLFASTFGGRRCLRIGTPFRVAWVRTGRCLAIASQHLASSHLVVQVRVCRSWVLHINGYRVDLAPISILPLLVGERYVA